MTTTTTAPPPSQRDVRLDFFRGIAMLIIFLAHVPGNWLTLYIPARFGFSDGAEMFVFLSGFAAAIAFGGTFRRAGFAIGTARVAYRCWQLYISHLMLFFAIATICVLGDFWLNTDVDYINRLNLYRFFNNTETAMVGLFTLTYVPNFFDIMPMYIGVLALLPVMVGLAKLHPHLAIAFSVGLYLATHAFNLHFVADTSNGRPWFFNPLGWQLLFFSGFALSAGWIKPPPPSRLLLVICIVFVAISIPISHVPTYTGDWRPWLWPIREIVYPLEGKTNHGIMRWLHFMALAYIAITLLKGKEHRLLATWAKPIVKTGQNALPVFLLSMMLAIVAGMALDVLGRNWNTVALVNISGLIILMLMAYVFGWYRSSPWKKRPAANVAPTPTPAPAPTPSYPTAKDGASTTAADTLVESPAASHSPAAIAPKHPTPAT